MMQPLDMAMVGPVAHDRVEVSGVAEMLVGGGTWYGAFPAMTLGIKVGIVTRMRQDDDHLLQPLRDAGAVIDLIPSFETTGIHNVYLDETLERRTCTVLGCAGPILPEHLPPWQPRAWYGAALMRGELPLETVRAMAARGPVSIDLQGYLRYRQGIELYTGPYDGLEELLSLTTWLKADLAEAQTATGSRDPGKAAAWLSARGPSEVVITGNNRVWGLVDGELREARMDPSSMRGRTGRGDTCMSTYVASRLLGVPLQEALERAAWVTSRKMEQPGPYLGPVRSLGHRLDIPS